MDRKLECCLLCSMRASALDILLFCCLLALPWGWSNGGSADTGGTGMFHELHEHMQSDHKAQCGVKVL